MPVKGVKALSDNYIWVYELEGKAIVVDPGEFDPINSYLNTYQLELEAILLTHDHDDHTGGAEELLETYGNVAVYGPEETERFNTKTVKDGDEFKVLGQLFNVFLTAGHTNGHISYLVANHLFCGDALFSAGCGRVFTKDYEAQYDALQKFNQLHDEINVYAGHEYTETNLTFAHDIEPDNEAIKEALDSVKELRSHDKPTLPSTIGREKEINLFMQADSLETFNALRLKRDNI